MSVLVTAEARVAPRLLLCRLADGVYRLNDELDLEKRCPRCREYWPADSEFFYRNGSEGDGLYRWCKACFREWFGARRLAMAQRQGRR